MIDVFESIYEIRKKQIWIGVFSPMIQLLSIKSMATF